MQDSKPALATSINADPLPRSLALCVVLALAALAVRFAAGFVFDDVTPFTTFYVAIVIATVWGGMQAGILCAVLGGALAAWFLPSATGVSRSGFAFYAVISGFIAWMGWRYNALMRKFRHGENAAGRHRDLVTEQNRILALIAADHSLIDVLDELARSIERFTRNSAIASILLLDDEGRRICHGAGPSLPAEFIAAIDGAEIGPSHGSCGTAAFTRQEVHVRDIENDALWAAYKDAALPHGFKACWSTPLLSHKGAAYGTFALYFMESRDPNAEEREVVGMLAQTAVLAIEADLAEAQRQLVLGEMAHRVKNILAVVHSLASRTLGHHLTDVQFREFEQRLTALGSVQDVLTRTDRVSVDLRELVEQVVVKPFIGRKERIVVEGATIQLVGPALMSLAMAFHELSTNSIKYGALSNSDGRVHISWNARGEDDSRFVLEWIESGGPPVDVPEKTGFGSRMIQRALALATKGEVVMDYRPDGLRCRILAPLGELAESEVPGSPRNSHW